jgi:hypothetical protein
VTGSRGGKRAQVTLHQTENAFPIGAAAGSDHYHKEYVQQWLSRSAGNFSPFADMLAPKAKSRPERVFALF